MKKFQILEVGVDQSTLKAIAKVKNLQTGATEILSGFDIENSTPREVVCIESRAGIKAGETYRLSAVEGFSWYTRVYLKDFPDIGFNSVYFAEMP